jgi:mannose-1-phosphate guanylyltransferase / mannose-6-phosphate isomerase
MGRNTLPAIMLGLDSIMHHEAQPLVGVFPSDHMISGSGRF